MCIITTNMTKIGKLQIFKNFLMYQVLNLNFRPFSKAKYLGTYALSFYRSQNVLCWSKFFEPARKIWLHLVSLQKLLCRHKKQFYWVHIIFLSGTKCLRLPQYVNKFLVWHKKFGPAQNILWPVKGQGICAMNQTPGNC